MRVRISIISVVIFSMHAWCQLAIAEKGESPADPKIVFTPIGTGNAFTAITTSSVSGLPEVGDVNAAVKQMADAAIGSVAFASKVDLDKTRALIADYKLKFLKPLKHSADFLAFASEDQRKFVKTMERLTSMVIDAQKTSIYSEIKDGARYASAVLKTVKNPKNLSPFEVASIGILYFLSRKASEEHTSDESVVAGVSQGSSSRDVGALPSRKPSSRNN